MQRCAGVGFVEGQITCVCSWRGSADIGVAAALRFAPRHVIAVESTLDFGICTPLTSLLLPVIIFRSDLCCAFLRIDYV